MNRILLLISLALCLPAAADTPPAVVTEPASPTIVSGSTATLSVAANGDPAPTYQWYQGASGVETTPVAGATSASFTTPALTGTTDYWVRVSNTAGSVDSATATVTVLGSNPDTLLHRWSFNGDLLDSAGGSDAVVVDVGANDTTLSATEITLTGGASDASDYVDLGEFLFPVDGSAYSIEIWATPLSIQFWSRVFDIGTAEDENLFLSWTNDVFPDTNRLEWRNDFEAALTTADDTIPGFTPGTKYHIVVTIEPGAGSGGGARVTWYARPANDPTPVVANGSFETHLEPAFFLDADHWLGASHYVVEDSTANASYDEVRYWGKALTAAEVSANQAAGPNALVRHPVITRQSVSRTIPNGSSTLLTIEAAGSPQPQIQWYAGASGDTGNPIGGETGPTYTTPSLTAEASYWARVSNSLGTADSDTITVSIGSPTPLQPVHRWSFDDATDSIGGADLTLFGSASLTGGQLELPGSVTPRTNYASVPIGATIAAVTEMSVESWFTMDQVTDWSRVWMFGNANGGVYPGRSWVTLVPKALGRPRLDIEVPSGLWTVTEEPPLPGALLPDIPYHVTAVFSTSADRVSLYVNGELVDSESMAGLSLAELGNTPENFFGAVVYWPDPDLDGRIDEVRIWNRSLAPDEILRSYQTGPDALPSYSSAAPVILAQPSDQAVGSGSTANLEVQVGGYPPPSLQWYEGAAGNTSNPIAGATSETLTTPAITATTSFWVRATNDSGSADSEAAVVTAASPVGDFTYTSDGSGITIAGYTGAGGNVVIPSTIDGLPVVTVGNSAFNGKTAITGITIPFTVTHIGDFAFGFCTGLTSVVVPDNVTSLGSGVFLRCSNLTSVTLPSSLTGIPDLTFSDCSSLPAVSIPSGVTTIGESAFSGCGALASIALPAGVTSIGESTFQNCTGLTSVTIPSSVTSIGASTFRGCTSLTSVTIPSGVTSIGGSAFRGCTSLSSITIPGSVSNVGTNSFFNCTSLTTLTFSDGVATLGTGAFGNCTSLTSVTIPGSVTSIASDAFRNSTSLAAVIFEGNAPTLGQWAFDGTAAGFTVYFNAGATGFTTPTWQGYPSAAIGGTAPAITFQPEDLTINSGGSADLIVFATGTPEPTYQWYFGTSGDTTNPVPGATSEFSSSPALTESTSYWVRVSNSAGSVDSITAVITVEALATDFTYTSDGSAITITGYTGPGGRVTIPASIDGLPVAAIGDNAFDNASITGVVVPESVASIGANVFNSCSQLASVTLPGSLTSIGITAFRDCVSLESITIPDGVTILSRYLFHSCTSLTSVILPSGLSEIDDGSFFGCTALESITIPDGVTSIGAQAFANCSSLASLTIPDSVTTIANSAFFNCSGLVSIDLPTGLTELTHNLFNGCASLESITIPNGVASISGNVFNGCSALQSITIPDGVTSIGVRAFDGCSSLLSVALPNSVTSIGNYAFYRCTGLATVTFPSSVTSIGTNAFQGASSLVDAVFEGNAPSLGSNAFVGTAAGFTVYFNAGASGFTSPIWQGYPSVAVGAIAPNITSQPEDLIITHGGSADLIVQATGTPEPTYQWYYGTSGNTTNPVPGATSDFSTSPALTESTSYWVRVSNSAGSVDSETAVITVEAPATDFTYTSDGSAITITGYVGAGGNVVIPYFIDGLPVEIIAGLAFAEKPGITGVTISSSVTSIGESAFLNCTGLTSVTISSSVTSIGDNAFWGCTGLTGMTLPSSVTSIGENAFRNCTGLTSVTIPSSITNFGGRAFQNCTGLTSVTIESGVISIGHNAFNGCTGLTSVTIPSSVTNFGVSAFVNCTGLTSVTIESGVTSIGIYAFYGCTGLSSVTIPSSVTSIGESTFQNCTGLTSVTIPSGVTSIGASTFRGCTSLTSVTIPSSVTSIGGSAFRGCTSLSSITIPGSVSNVGTNSFFNCSSLTTLTLSDGVASIGSGAFANCSSLTSVTIPGSVTSIDAEAFRNCFSLAAAIFEGNAPTLGLRAFNDTSPFFSVYYLSGSTGFTTPTWQGYPSALASPVVTGFTGDTSISPGESTTISTTATGVSPISYEWYIGETGDTSSPIPGATTDNYATPELTETTSYWVRATNAYGSADSDTATVTVFIPLAPEIAVEFPAGTDLASGSTRNFGTRLVGTGPATQTLTVRNIGNADLTSLAIVTAGPQLTDYVVDASGFPPSLAPGESATLPVSFAPTAGGTRDAVLEIFSNDAKENPFALSLTGQGETPPSIDTQPAPSQSLINGASATVGVTATAHPAATYQWYRGFSGDTTDPVPGATSASYTTPSLTESAKYWVRVTNTHGSVDSDTAFVEVDPISTNAALADLVPDSGNLSPAFNPALTNYSVLVASTTTEIRFTPSTAHPAATIEVNGQPLASGSPSQPILLEPGSNPVSIEVTAQDDTTTRNYQIDVIRAEPITVTTGVASDVGSVAATLNGSVEWDGDLTVRFEYGTDTSYGNLTPPANVDGTAAPDVSAALSNLTPGTIYHFRLVADNGVEVAYGTDMQLETATGPPLAITGQPAGVTTAGATLVGAVDGHGLETTVHFEYGTTELLGTSTATETISAGTGYRDVLHPVTGLTPNADYFVQLVATSAAGTTRGTVVTFTAQATGGGDGTPTAAPDAATGEAVSITNNSVELRGTVDAKGGVTIAYFEYGTSPSLGLTSPSQPIGDVNAPAEVSIPFSGLSPGTTYHYRAAARNSLGTTVGETLSFQTSFLPPGASTGGVTVLSSTSVLASGSVDPNGAETTIRFRYGTDPGNLDLLVDAIPATAGGNSSVSVTAVLPNLREGTTYFYQLVATSTGGETTGTLRSFDVAVLSGLDQRFPDLIDPSAHQGALRIDGSPAGVGGWRIAGEVVWRDFSATATGLAPGDRLIEYRPAAGHIAPPTETVSIPAVAGTQVLTRSYTPSSTPGSGRLQVFLKPDTIASTALPEADRAQWRFPGEPDTAWRDSGTEVAGLVPGQHVIEAKSLAGFETPAPVSVAVADGQTSVATITYFLAADPVGAAPGPLAFPTVSTDSDLPYAFVGQILSEAGASSGFVVRPGVVATAGHVVFDDGTLAAATGLNWLFQRDVGIHEPVPVAPRGFFLLSGYAAQRTSENTPGESSPESQNLDAAAMYFSNNEIGRNGHSGYLASDLAVNAYVVSDLDKTLAGYPVENVAEADIGRMHATPVSNVGFDSSYLQTYLSTEIHGTAGMSGGPLFVRDDQGTWYPAAIFLGGTGETIVRAIDSDVADLFGFAEAGAAGSGDETGGSGVIGDPVPISTPGLGAVRVLIEPAAARNNGARWRINPSDPYEFSGSQIEDLAPNTYTVLFSTVPGFLPPTPQAVEVSGGELATLTFTYEEIIPPPVITSPAAVTVIRLETLGYQITTSPAADSLNLYGALPPGVEFDSEAGTLSGEPQVAGIYPLEAGATNSGGASSKSITLSVLPILEPQSVSASRGIALSHPLTSGETGDGLTWAATDLPDGLSLDPATGVVSGTPALAGLFSTEVSLTRNGATASAEVTFTIGGEAPAFVIEPPETRSLEFGTGTTFAVEATGEPDPAYQWYTGSSGNTANPVAGATSATFSTPAITGQVSYWVAASNLSGTANSRAVTVTPLASSNPDLSGLETDAGSPTPFFTSSVTGYRLTVANSVSEIRLLPTTKVSQTTLLINGTAAASGTYSTAVPLAVGATRIETVCTAGDGIATKTYTLDVTRLPEPARTTDPATLITDQTARFNGRVTPYGPASVFFEYGTSMSYGKQTSPVGISGTGEVVIARDITGLAPEATHHYRIVVVTAVGTFFGNDVEFSTSPQPPTVATGGVFNSTTAEATLSGAVNPNGLPITLWFEFGIGGQLGNQTPTFAPDPDAGNSAVDVSRVITGLIANNTYSYRLVASSTAGTSYGDIETFVATNSEGTADGIADSPPTVTTGVVDDQTTTTATLRGSVFPNDGSTEVWFEYGTDTGYGGLTPAELVGNGSEERSVTALIAGLEPEMTYHFRIVGRNSLGTSYGDDAMFQTEFNEPAVTIDTVEPISESSVRLTGTVDPRGSATSVDFLYGTDGSTYPFGSSAIEGEQSGTGIRQVTVVLTDLDPSVAYSAVLEASSDGGTSTSSPLTFQPGALLGLVRETPQPVNTDERSGEIHVTTFPDGVGAWRFVGDTVWRQPGVATGLTTGNRVVEFLPVDGYIRPPSEAVSVVSGQAPVTLEGLYYEAGEPGRAALTVHLEPASASDPALPVASRAQWRVAGVTGDPWRDSGVTVSELPTGSHLIECKPIPGQQTAQPRSITLEEDETRTVTLTYFAATAPMFSPPAPMSHEDAVAAEDQAFAFVGQVRGDKGTASGFAVKRRVVCAAANTVFDESTLSFTGNIEWLWLPDPGNHEPQPIAARGAYVIDGYASQREAEGTPGTLSAASQNLNVVTLYFQSDVAGGGSSGFFASEETPNPFLVSPDEKTLAGYPVVGASPTNLGRLHVTNPSTTAFAPLFDKTYDSAAIRGFGGMEGGPLCVRPDDGAAYPAGIYVGGTNRGIVRAIDSTVIDLVSRAEVSANGGDNNTGGGITHTSFSSVGSSATKGAITVTIKPAAARNAGAGWRLKPETSYRQSGSQKSNLDAGTYVLQMKSVSGYPDPPNGKITVKKGKLTEITFDYSVLNTAPTISSIGYQAIPEDGTTGSIPFTIGDDESSSGSLTISRSSSNAALVPNSRIVIGGSGSNRTVTVTPLADQTGRTVITITVSDGSLTASEAFTFDVNPVNDAPTISPIAAQTLAVNTSSGALPFTIGDLETSASALVLGKTSSNTTLVPAASVILGGSGTNRTVTIHPAAGQIGSATITLSVSDGALTTNRSFIVTVTGDADETWRFANFGSTDPTAVSADHVDADGDGNSNGDERIAGTDPNKATDAFRVLGSSRSGSTFEVQVPTKTGRTYRLERTTTFPAGGWVEVDREGPVAASGTTTLSDPDAPSGTAIYRVAVSMDSP